MTASALTDGINGLECLQAIADGAIAHLTPGGWLLLEHGYDQGAEVRAMLEPGWIRCGPH